MASVAEAEVAGLFINTNKAILIRHTLTKMGHPQPPTPLETDNTTVQGILTGKFRQKIKIDQHAFLVVKGSNRPKTVQCRAGTW